MASSMIGKTIVLTDARDNVPRGTRMRILRRDERNRPDVPRYEVAREDGCRMDVMGRWRDTAWWVLETEVNPVRRWWKFTEVKNDQG